MESQRKPFGRSATACDEGGTRVLNVALPEPYEGVGNALRATFVPGDGGMPSDMMALLAKLDRH
ncbi:hypothetical protein ASE85_06390 [Sphingobium sp. Leaf26]|uniref:hypothetical protein n=1 Tax=Sphingobium sp. Leaf26 TaxID=1735693 RepID=UPI0006F9D593|nr:hypothetical protein [Sphingobium sp. Leaf26]KQN04637.1 hypothetical protein ASE85_06390 [Sphingobium sp. Leaf26]